MASGPAVTPEQPDARNTRDGTPALPRSVAPACVIGCGRSYRRDDQIGLRVVEALANDLPPDTATRTSEAPGVDLIADLEGVELLVIVDAARATPGFPVGQVTCIDYLGSAAGTRGPQLACADAAERVASHTLGVTHALKLGRDLNILPGNVWIYTVAGEDFDTGTRMSPPVTAAIEAVAQRIRSDITAWRRQREDDHE